jgi:NTE family protein
VPECQSRDTTFAPISPIECRGTPRSACDTFNRLNEVSFNAVLLKEFPLLALLRGVAHPSDDKDARCARMRTHRIDSEVMLNLGYSPKLNADWDFLTMLRDEDHNAAEALPQGV